MKQQIQTRLIVLLEGIAGYWSALKQIEVAFAQYRNGPVLKTSVWKSDGSGDITRDGNTILIPWTREETALFRENSAFFMDVRPTLQTGDDLTVEPVKLTMDWTLFGGGST